MTATPDAPAISATTEMLAALRGVSMQRDIGDWRVWLRINGRRIVGIDLESEEASLMREFETLRAAAIARAEAELGRGE